MPATPAAIAAITPASTAPRRRNRAADTPTDVHMLTTAIILTLRGNGTDASRHELYPTCNEVDDRWDDPFIDHVDSIDSGELGKQTAPEMVCAAHARRRVIKLPRVSFAVTDQLT